MSLLVRTSDVPVAQRRDAWRRVVCDTLGPLDMRSDPDVPLEGEIHAGRLGRVTVGHVRTSTPHSVHRTPRQIRGDDRELFRVVMPIAGSAVLSQAGRQVRLGQGEFAMYDFGRPYELAYDSAVRLAVFGFPRESLVISDDSLNEVIVRRLGGDTGSGALVAPLLRRVTLDIESYRSASAVRLSTVVTDLLTTVVAERLELTTPPETRERALLVRIHSFIEEHLGDTDLNPGVLAAAHHISVRFLHRLFESEQTTAAAWIRHRRLERCRRDLADPRQLAVAVSAVAARWGLPDPAHFSRLFRSAYGMPPAEFRRSSLMRAL
jgi:AraC-like DNA-binding protein